MNLEVEPRLSLILDNLSVKRLSLLSSFISTPEPLLMTFSYNMFLTFAHRDRNLTT